MPSSHPFAPGSHVAAYFRDSGGEEQDLSIPQQETHFLTWCQQNDLQPGSIFKDAARPGSSVVGRAGFQQMIRHFRNSAPEKGLVIWKYSRFSRDVDDAAFYRADLRRLGYIVHSLNDNIPEGPEGRFFEAALDWMNQRFLEDLSGDVKRGLRHLVEVYRCVPGTPPRGFLRQPINIGLRRDGSPHIANRWVPDPDLVPVIRLAFEMRARGESLAQIHKATKLYGSLNSYRTFFTNRIYLGILEFGDLVVENYCTPFVTIEIWNAVQKRVEAYAQARFSTDHPRRANSIYLLSGLVYCARCGGPMYGNTVTRNNINGRDEAYRCSRSRRRRDCDAGRISRHAVEEAVLHTLTEYILQPDSLAAIHALAATSSNRGESERQQRLAANALERKELSRQIANVTNAIARKGGSDALLDTLTALEQRRAIANAENEQLQITIEPIPTLSEDQIKQFSTTLVATLQHTDQETRRLVLRGFVQKITVERTGRKITGMVTYYYPPKQRETPPDPSNDLALPRPNPGKGQMLPISPGTVGAPRYRQHFTHPIIDPRFP